MRGATLSNGWSPKDMVSIHAPHARGDKSDLLLSPLWLFQFTPLMRGATQTRDESTTSQRFNSRPSCEGRPELAAFGVAGESFNSRPSCEGRQGKTERRSSMGVSIHAPHARGDLLKGCQNNQQGFQFTPLMRGATSSAERCSKVYVSIHAPHARGDRDKS